MSVTGSMLLFLNVRRWLVMPLRTVKLIIHICYGSLISNIFMQVIFRHSIHDNTYIRWVMLSSVRRYPVVIPRGNASYSDEKSNLFVGADNLWVSRRRGSRNQRTSPIKKYACGRSSWRSKLELVRFRDRLIILGIGQARSQKPHRTAAT